MEKVYVVGTPRHVPEGWTVWNAPRPLYGEQTWQSDFITGRFYAAQDPNDEETRLPYAEVVKQNEQLDGCELVLLSWDEFNRLVDQWAQVYARENSINLEDFDREEIVDSFINLAKERYVRMMG